MSPEDQTRSWLQRWSRRKQTASASIRADEAVQTGSAPAQTGAMGGAYEAGTATEEHRHDAPPTGEASAGCRPIAREDTDDATVLTDRDMPPLDSLDATSSLSPFFNEGVSAGLRRAALRRVFALPKYNIRDGLNDYDEDYTAFVPLGDTVTADMRFHEARRAQHSVSADPACEEVSLPVKEEAETPPAQEPAESGERPVHRPGGSRKSPDPRGEDSAGTCLPAAATPAERHTGETPRADPGRRSEGPSANPRAGASAARSSSWRAVDDVGAGSPSATGEALMGPPHTDNDPIEHDDG